MTDDDRPADPDIDDLRQAQRGDREAFSRIVARHQETIFRQMRRFSPEMAVREELTQDVFVEAWFSLANFRPAAPFLHWLQTIATRVGYKYWKELQKRRRTVPLRDDDRASPAADDPADGGGEADGLVPEDAEARLSALLARLAPEDRLVLTLMYFESRSAGEIAERLGWNAAMVRMRAFRARRKLKKWLESGK